MNRDFKRILIIGHSNIGDVCYDLVVIAPLRRAYPGGKITFLTSSQSRQLLENYPGISEIIIFDKRGQQKGFYKLIELIKLLRTKKFDLCIVLKKSLFFYFLNIPCIWSLKRNTRLHVADNYLNLLKIHGIKIEEKARFDFGFNNQELGFADSFFAKNRISPKDSVIAIGPFSNWSLKCWPVEKWNELIKTVSSQFNFKIIVLGKIGNDAYSKYLAKNISTTAISAINQCSLKESMALIKRSRLFISSDTSLLHIASAMNVPCIGLYGPTANTAYYPYFHLRSMIIADNLPSCAPCLKTNRFAECKKEGKAPCMDAISVEEVLEAAKKELKINK
ncbi:MAG: glycosyltransferase family 9 protein [Candidatus Omnitrophota bacterium]